MNFTLYEPFKERILNCLNMNSKMKPICPVCGSNMDIKRIYPYKEKQQNVLICKCGKKYK